MISERDEKHFHGQAEALFVSAMANLEIGKHNYDDCGEKCFQQIIIAARKKRLRGSSEHGRAKPDPTGWHHKKILIL